MYPEGFSDTCVLGAETFSSSREISGDPPHLFQRISSAIECGIRVDDASPRYCKSMPFNFMMQSAYRSIHVSCSHNDSILIRKELRFVARYACRVSIRSSSIVFQISRSADTSDKNSKRFTPIRCFLVDALRKYRAIVNIFDTFDSKLYRWWIRNRAVGDPYLCFTWIFNVNSRV